MRTEDLIVKLAHEGGPWRPLAPVRVRTTRWLLLAAASSGLAILVIGARPDIFLSLQRLDYLSLAAVTVTAGILAASSAMRLSVPGAERTPLWRSLAVALAVCWALLLAVRLGIAGAAWPRLEALPNHWACVAEIVGLSIVSGGAFVVMLRRAAPLRPRWSIGLAALASAAISATAVQIICPIDDPAHHLLSHVTPVVLVIAFGVLGGRTVLGRANR